MADMLQMIELRKISKNTEDAVAALKVLGQQVTELNKTMSELVKVLNKSGPMNC